MLVGKSRNLDVILRVSFTFNERGGLGPGFGALLTDKVARDLRISRKLQ